MGDDAGRAEALDHLVGEIAGALRRAARQDDGVAGGMGLPDRCGERTLDIGNGAEADGLAAVLLQRGGDDRTVGIVDGGGPQRLAGRDQFVAGGDHRDARLAPDCRLCRADRGEHPHLARAEEGAAPQQRLATGDVRAGKGDVLPRRRGAQDREPAVLEARVLDHHHRVGAARDRPARGDGGGMAGDDRQARLRPAGDGLRREGEPGGALLAGARDVGGENREAVDHRAVEGRRIDRGGHRLGQHPPDEPGQRHALRPERAERQGAAEAGDGLLAREHFEELVLDEG